MPTIEFKFICFNILKTKTEDSEAAAAETKLTEKGTDKNGKTKIVNREIKMWRGYPGV